MAGGGVDDGSTYSPLVGGVYVFNLIVGAGALAMPKAFSESGYIGGCILVALLAAFSYLTVTFMIEAMAIANRFRRHEERQRHVQSSEVAPLINETEAANPFEITHRTEMAEMAKMFFSTWGLRFFYACIVIYLYGDLCIYVVAIPKSLQSVACGNLSHQAHSHSHHENHTYAHHHCMGTLDSQQAYYVFLTAFAVVLGPFCFFNAQKTKALQIFTTVMRWSTFIIMIVIALIGIANKKGFNHDDHVPHASDVSTFKATGLPVLFGVSIYSFMCHHSLPSLLTPITRKKTLGTVLSLDFLLCFLFYALLSLTAVFRFQADSLKDLYTLNFTDFPSKFVSYFLGLFPVFTLSANFPIIAITLRNNLRHLFEPPDRPFPAWVTRFVLPIAAIGPPILVGYFTEDVGFLVSFTGSYAGVGIQYVIPALLCYFARQKARRVFETYDNPHASFFSHKGWILFVVVWSVVCIGVVTFNHIYTRS
ncbi:hypothetical protein PTSG_07712 [Salpingoeca rosetta]|uniref:Amino acid transporter transmembrane domain-containing protein n=1 Tax=Salpingoeca rosetta (strain ATCC 50818 / BSB-021) TaxID=946362 RepID=F2UHJ6_SALR5|nr:uncharacterized protein PTSG_07712 [Salpingoeca rosetta]EGD76595.1 hypothetical protein PTSG_07712 [Salpingoeca rosetta]|eukprot:XP_004991509.1 hypothetical protein PTSG_07712 [Salpingoeca rosetta]